MHYSFVFSILYQDVHHCLCMSEKRTNLPTVAPPISFSSNVINSVIIFFMLTPEQIELRLDKILLRVQKPGRYVGGELNSVQKDWDSVRPKLPWSFRIFTISAFQMLGSKFFTTRSINGQMPWLNAPMHPGSTWKPSCAPTRFRSTRSNQNDR